MTGVLDFSAIFTKSWLERSNELVTAAAAVVVVAAAVVVATVATIATVVVVATAAATALSGFDFLFGGIADSLHFATEAHFRAGEGVVEVHGDFFIGDIKHGTIHLEAVGGHHRQSGANVHHFGVEFTVDVEHFFFEVNDVFVAARAECLFGGSHHVEVTADFHVEELLFEGFEQTGSSAVNDYFGLVGVDLVHQGFFAVVSDFVEVVSDFNVFTVGDFFHFFSC